MDETRLTRSRDWEEKAIRHTILLSSTMILSQLLLILRGFIVAKFLGPNLYGLWHGLRVIVNNSDYSNLGIYEGMKREVPYYRGKGDLKRADEMTGSAYFSGILLASLASCILIGVSLLFSNRFDPVTKTCLWIVAGILMARQRYWFLCKRFESEGKFFSLSKTEVLSVWLGVPLAIGLMFLLHIYGFLIGILLGYLFAGLVVMKGETVAVRHRFRMDYGLALLKVGFPIILIGLLLSALKSMDKLMILYYLGRTRLGYYGMAFVAASFIGFFPGALRSVLYPRLMEKLGEKGDRLYLKGFLFDPSYLLAFLILLPIGVVYLFAPVGIRILLPQYIPSLTSMKILTLAFYPIALLEIPLSILIGINLQKKLLPILLVCLVLSSGIHYLVLSLGFGIEGVSFSIGLTFMALSSFIMFLTLDQFNQSSKEKTHFFCRIYLPFFYATSVLLFLDRTTKPETGPNGQALFMAFVQFFFFLASLAPVFIYTNRKINIVDRIKRAVRVKGALGKVSFFED